VGFSLTPQTQGAKLRVEFSLNFCMDSYSILDNSPSQAGPETAPPNLVSLDSVSLDSVSLDPVSAGRVSALPPVPETLRFPGEDGGKSLSEMAQRDLDATLQLLAERAQYITGASGAAIALRQGETMVCCASSGPSAPELGAHLQVDSGLSGESVRTRQLLQCDDAENDPRVNRDSCRAFGIASVVVMPLIRGEEVYGVFELLSGRPRAFEERDFIALNRLAEMIQTAVEHSDAAHRAENELGQPAVAGSIAAPVPAGVTKVETDLLNVDLLDRDMHDQDLLDNDPLENDLLDNGLKTGSVEPPAEISNMVAQPVESEDVPLPVLGSASVETPALPAVLLNPVKAELSNPLTTIAFGNLGKCETCGFPVSEGRKLCLDCEAASPDALSSGLNVPGVFGEESPSWVRSHMYFIGAAVIAVATIALLIWRL
jgi:putative methionine-R-sulfoxide reductase with GAF domain